MRRRERNKTSSSFFPCALLGINIFNLFHLTPSFHSFLPFSILELACASCNPPKVFNPDINFEGVWTYPWFPWVNISEV
ncbi:hypothetical protein VNO80_16351 [Phaseolus coccineus]|uniref:Uncharacterized protein n=1 Tax=Phaseolus coccineus TaxID=3886 RepID=A0AAN9MLW8_PHACN